MTEDIKKEISAEDIPSEVLPPISSGGPTVSSGGETDKTPSSEATGVKSSGSKTYEHSAAAVESKEERSNKEPSGKQIFTQELQGTTVSGNLVYQPTEEITDLSAVHLIVGAPPSPLAPLANISLGGSPYQGIPPPLANVSKQAPSNPPPKSDTTAAAVVPSEKSSSLFDQWEEAAKTHGMLICSNSGKYTNSKNLVMK